MCCKSLISPKNLKTKIPLSKEEEYFIKTSREKIIQIIQWISNQLLVIVWPCSIHNVNEWLEYAEKLKKVSKNYKNLYVVMRAYLEKPRTTIWWKWLIFDPYLNGQGNIEQWLVIARKFLKDLANLEIPIATEILDIVNFKYYDDLISYWAIWARTSESQQHREIASWFNFPVWFKNWTHWDIDVAINAIISAKKWHNFISINEEWKVCIQKTKWNNYWHIILRWGKKWPNYDELSVKNTLELLKLNNINLWLIIDVSHWNSNKKALNQINVLEYVSKQIKINKKIIWVMIESNINYWNQSFIPGKDSLNNLKYWISITDECISLEQTDKMLYLLNKSKK